MEETIPETEPLVQFTCKACFGESWLRVPFLPQFCAHCGKALQFGSSRIIGD
jgi:hypothetical protein